MMPAVEAIGVCACAPIELAAGPTEAATTAARQQTRQRESARVIEAPRTNAESYQPHPVPLTHKRPAVDFADTCESASYCRWSSVWRFLLRALRNSVMRPRPPVPGPLRS